MTDATKRKPGKLEQQIRELCSEVLATNDEHQLRKLCAELRKSITDHIEGLRGIAVELKMKELSSAKLLEEFEKKE